MAAGDTHVFPGLLTPVLTLLSFPSNRLLFSHAFSRGKRRKYAGKKVRPNRVSNSKPPGHESNTLTTERGAGSRLFESESIEYFAKNSRYDCQIEICTAEGFTHIFLFQKCFRKALLKSRLICQIMVKGYNKKITKPKVVIMIDSSRVCQAAKLSQ